MTRMQVVDEGTEMNQPSAGIDFEISTDEPTAAANPRNATETTALAVAATAALELTNLFFLLRGDTERHCCSSRIASITAVQSLAVLSAFAALLSAAGLLLVRHATGQHAIISAACRRVLLVASAASLFVASAGTALSLLYGHRLLRFGADS